MKQRFRPRVGRSVRRPRALLTVGAVAVLAGGAAVALGTANAGAAGAAAAPKPVKTFTVTMRGDGHGHGLSQYGAYGAALGGRTTAQILSFYYPGTTLSTLSSPTLLVKLSGTGATTDVAADPGLRLAGMGALPTAGVLRYRIIAGPGDLLTLTKLNQARGSTWTVVRAGLPSSVEFSTTAGRLLRLFLADGSSTVYSGVLRAVRTPGATVTTVNRVSNNAYVAGVVPREMPASWRSSAVDAQAVAARSYAWYEHQHPASYYDICDTDSCQVYGGVAHYSASGTLLYTQDAAAALDTSNQILTYRGSAIFAQYSASNGGWTVSGGQPYLVAKADPYDSSASGDPYLSYSTSVPASAVAGYFGLRTVTAVTIKTRDGHGTWGGRVLTATVSGTTSSGAARTVAATGFDLQYALGLGTTWFQLAALS